jgi:hypothetical protein
VVAGVTAAGFVLCTIGWCFTPHSTQVGLAQTWWAELLSTLFWGAAFMAVYGLCMRRRRGLIAAFVAACAFLAAPIATAVVDPGIMGRQWTVEVICALEFVAVCAYALRVNRLVPVPVR